MSNRLFAYQRIYHDIRGRIESGELSSGTKLPALRTLAKELGVARNTIETAYRQLLEEGYVRSKKGSGYFVEDLAFPSIVPYGSANQSEHHKTNTAIARSNTENDPLTACRFNFSYGDKDPESFPTDQWKYYVAKALDDDVAGLSAYTPAFGLWELRAALARKLKETRGVRCEPDQIALMPGTQSAIGALIDLFDAEERHVCMEDPGYYAARSVFESRACTVHPIPACQGSEAFVKALRKNHASLLWVTPSHQFPLGRTMPLKTRLEAIAWAQREDAYIIEDDYCCEFHYGHKSMPSLQSLDTSGRVIYLGCMSKIMSPALRISYLVLPPALVERWKERSPLASSPVSWLDQKALALFMTKGKWNGHVRRVVNRYRARHNLLVGCLETSLGGNADIVGSGAGQHVLVGLNDGRDSAELIEAALRNDVRVYSLEHCWHARKHPMGNYVLVGYSSIADELIPEGVERLREAWLS